ncbi:hypothetical protein FTUN_3270 [Frigoriglobus tundricola]|uniref:Uncharacterized protein n=1 Tax=Frigoriglobus tundricola TaxID=2774151 RepID=A0A6M5YQS9_9BACT|nr:hypothetical protein FTUN_3270 [Frigoriglobus tundricola]
MAVARAVLKRWAAPDPKRFREVMPGLAGARWAQLGFDPDAVLGRLEAAADLAAGARVDERIGQIAEPLVPRGWLARTPEPTHVSLALDALNRLIGPPASSLKRPPTPVEDALVKAAADVGAAFALDLHNLLPVLVDDPQFRLAGTEELYRQFLANTDRLIDRFLQSAVDLDGKAVAGFECLSHYAHYHKGMRKPTAAELGEALRQYPRARFQALTFRQVVAAYQSVREALSAQLAEVSAARQRLAAVVAPEPTEGPADPAVPLRRLMPPGCATVGEAVDRFLKVLTDEDMTEIDRRVQSVLEPEAGGLLHVCSNSAAGVGGVVNVVYEETRAHLDARLGEVGLAAMFAERFRTPQQAERAIEQAYQEAEPAWVGNGPWVGAEVAVLSCPGGPTGEALRELARRAIPVAGLPVTDSRDDLTVYREWPAVPLAALPARRAGARRRLRRAARNDLLHAARPPRRDPLARRGRGLTGAGAGPAGGRNPDDHRWRIEGRCGPHSAPPPSRKHKTSARPARRYTEPAPRHRHRARCPSRSPARPSHHRSRHAPRTGRTRPLRARVPGVGRRSRLADVPRRRPDRRLERQEPAEVVARGRAAGGVEGDRDRYRLLHRFGPGRHGVHDGRREAGLLPVRHRPQDRREAVGAEGR